MSTEPADALGHSFTNYVSDGNANCTQDGTQTAVCDRGCGATDTIADPGSAGHSFINYVSNQNATCTVDGTKTAVCGRGCGATDTMTDPGTAGHIFTQYASDGNATCTQDGTQTAACDRGCGATDTMTDPGTAGHIFTQYVSDNNATCTQNGTQTAACDRGCGATHTIVESCSTLAHDYEAVTTQPTCTKEGYTTYTCTHCLASRTADATARLGHRYGAWTGNGSGTHSNQCLRRGCGHIRQAQCRTLTYTLAGKEVALCPVCGEVSSGELLLPLENAAAQAVTGALPRGELVLRHGTLADGTQYLMVSFVYAGQPEPLQSLVKITLPEDILNVFSLLLMNADGTQAPIPCTAADGFVSFELDFTPAEGMENDPTALLQLAPLSL